MERDVGHDLDDEAVVRSRGAHRRQVRVTDSAPRSHHLQGERREGLLEGIGGEPLAPDDLIASIASMRLPEGRADSVATAFDTDPLQDELLERFGIQVPIHPWPAPPHRLIRISAQLYNRETDYARLRDALLELLPAS